MDSATRPADPSLYERDFHAWCMAQAEHLRGRARPGVNDALDYENLAEEIEGLARTDKRAIRSHMINLLMHLLKWRHQPQRRGVSWENSIFNARAEILHALKISPSLHSYAREVIEDAYPSAVRKAETQTKIPRRDFPTTCPFTPEQVLDPEFLPAEDDGQL